LSSLSSRTPYPTGIIRTTDTDDGLLQSFLVSINHKTRAFKACLLSFQTTDTTL